MEQAANVFIANYPKPKRTYSRAPLALLPAGGVFIDSVDHRGYLSESMNS